MAYTKKYFLERIKQVNEIYLQHANDGVSNEFIYHHYIREQFHISRTTFYQYLTIPYKTEIAKIQAQQAQQNQLNFDEKD